MVMEASSVRIKFCRTRTANKGPGGWLNPKAFASPALGTYGNIGMGALTQAINDPRIMQFALKYTF
jgi:hypothetical protein